MFDEDYFCYTEEVEYCTRVRRAGFKVIYTHQAKIWHKKPIKAKFQQKIPQQRNAIALAIYYQGRNKFRFMKKHATKRQYHNFLLYFFGYYFWFMTGVHLVYHHDIKWLVSFYRGVRDGLFDSAVYANLYSKD